MQSKHPPGFLKSNSIFEGIFIRNSNISNWGRAKKDFYDYA